MIDHDLKQVCVRGHQVTDYGRTQPESLRPFCEKCGAKTITACQSCGVPMDGYAHIEGVIGFSESEPPEFCASCGEPFPWTPKPDPSYGNLAAVPIINAVFLEPELKPLPSLERLLARFPNVVRQLQSRHDKRTALKIKDEYDVQDLLRALLAIDFDDVRLEEWAPSYAGGSSRMDFLLKREKIVVEAKKTRDGLADRQLGDQLAIDIVRYRSHPDCQTLVCFTYDPEHRIKNPLGLKADLEMLSSSQLAVVVHIFPH